VRAQVKRDLVVADVDVGVVVPLLSHLGEVLDEADRMHKVGEAEGTRESVAFEPPLPQLTERRIDLFLALPIAKLDRLVLTNRLKEIGRSEGATSLAKAD
jgi:hypothetical protein